jgi:hypothetical protein
MPRLKTFNMTLAVGSGLTLGDMSMRDRPGQFLVLGKQFRCQEAALYDEEGVQ